MRQLYLKHVRAFPTGRRHYFTGDESQPQGRDTARVGGWCGEAGPPDHVPSRSQALICSKGIGR